MISKGQLRPGLCPFAQFAATLGMKKGCTPLRFWWYRSGPMFPSDIRECRVEGVKSCHRSRQLDKVFVNINGARHDIWRTVDHAGEAVESFVPNTRDKK